MWVEATKHTKYLMVAVVIRFLVLRGLRLLLSVQQGSIKSVKRIRPTQKWTTFEITGSSLRDIILSFCAQKKREKKPIGTLF